jgi:hypothetical protein
MSHSPFRATHLSSTLCIRTQFEITPHCKKSGNARHKSHHNHSSQSFHGLSKSLACPASPVMPDIHGVTASPDSKIDQPAPSRRTSCTLVPLGPPHPRRSRRGRCIDHAISFDPISASGVRSPPGEQLTPDARVRPMQENASTTANWWN